MEKNSNNIPTAAHETNESQLPIYSATEHMESSQEDCNFSQSKARGIPLHIVIIGMLLIMLLMNAIEMRQYKEYSSAIEQEAYVLSVSINLLEENLLFNYGFLPEDLGFADLRDAWISNACYETAMPYYEALKEAWDYFENNPSPFEFSEPVIVI